jgi:hypothetical protein
MVAVISTFDVRLLLPIFLLCTACTASMKPNWKPILIMLGFLFIMNGVIGSLMIWLIKPASGLTYVAPTEQILWQVSSHFYLSKELLWYVGMMFFKRVVSFSVAITFVLSITLRAGRGLNGHRPAILGGDHLLLAFRTIPDIARDYTDIGNRCRCGDSNWTQVCLLRKKAEPVCADAGPVITSASGKVEMFANSMACALRKKKPQLVLLSMSPKGRICGSTFTISSWCLPFYISSSVGIFTRRSTITGAPGCRTPSPVICFKQRKDLLHVI